jgi:hypothetical protein
MNVRSTSATSTLLGMTPKTTPFGKENLVGTWTFKLLKSMRDNLEDRVPTNGKT